MAKKPWESLLAYIQANLTQQDGKKSWMKYLVLCGKKYMSFFN
jgi:hypothetical protein